MAVVFAEEIADALTAVRRPIKNWKQRSALTGTGPPGYGAPTREEPGDGVRWGWGLADMARHVIVGAVDGVGTEVSLRRHQLAPYE